MNETIKLQQLLQSDLEDNNEKLKKQVKELKSKAQRLIEANETLKEENNTMKCNLEQAIKKIKELELINSQLQQELLNSQEKFSESSSIYEKRLEEINQKALMLDQQLHEVSDEKLELEKTCFSLSKQLQHSKNNVTERFDKFKYEILADLSEIQSLSNIFKEAKPHSHQYQTEGIATYVP